MIDHDVKPGPLGHCQISGSRELFEVIDLGHQPLCDSLLSSMQLHEPEVTYPLRLMLCPSSGLAQLDYVVPGDVVYPPSYPYRTSVSAALVEYQQAMARGLVERFGGVGYVIDIGSNDGTLLRAFAALGWEVLGVEPTEAGRACGVATVVEPFTERLAFDMVARDGRPDLITMTNVFAHMAKLGDVMRGIATLMHGKSVFVTESHYLLDVLDKLQFDTIYHEHIRTYSLRSICQLVEQYGMEVFDVERGARYGGNIRAYIGWKGVRPVSPRVPGMLQAEVLAGLFDPIRWRAWAGDVRAGRNRFMDLLYDISGAGLHVGGVSAPGRAATLINYYGIDASLVPYLAEPVGSHKIGKYMPGCGIPIVPNTSLAKNDADYLVLFAWHYADVIAKRLRAEGVTAKLVAPLPRLTAFD